MKKIIENFYFFSKLTTSLSLFFVLLGACYIFYKTYQKQDKIVLEEKNKNIVLKNQIEKNYSEIKSLEKEINNNNKLILNSLNELEKKSLNNKEYENSSFVNTIQEINKNIIEISNEVLILKNKINEKKSLNDQTDSNLILNNSKIDLINIIKIKFENNKKFINEIDILENITTTSKKNNFEKLRIVAQLPYNGNLNLLFLYKEEMQKYIKEYLSYDSNNIFFRSILAYIEIEPSTKNIINDKRVAMLFDIEKSIQDNDIKKAYEKLLLIKDHDTKFIQTFDQIKIYIEFNKNLEELI